MPCPRCGCARPAAAREAPLVGRARELAALRRVIDRLCDGQAGMVGIAGPAGIGKSRLVEAALDYAKERGCYDFLIRGFEPSAALPYWTLIEALRAPGNVSAALDPAVGVDALVGALRDAREAPFGGTTGFERRDAGIHARVYEANAAVLRRLTATRPLVVIADDLQWFDRGTLDLMRHAVWLAKTLPLLLICSLREEGEDATDWRPVQEDAVRAGFYEELRLEGLDGAAARRLALSAAPAPLSDHALTDVLRLAEGNPFYIVQLARAAGETTEGGRLSLPGAMRGVREQRLAALSLDGRAVVQALAVVGRACPLDLLATLVSLPLPALAAALDETIGAGIVIDREASGRPRYDLAHALLRETAVRGLNGLARARLHLRIADALHERRAAGDSMPAAEVAAQYLDARPLAPSERALAYMREAADEAAARGAPERAARFLAAAIELLVEQGTPAGEIARLRLTLVEMHGRAGDTEAAERQAAAALGHWRSAGATHAEAEVHAVYAEQLNPRLRPHDVVAAAEAGLAALGEERSPLAARLRYLRAHARLMLDDSGDLLPTAEWMAAGALEAAEPAVGVWRRLLRVLWHSWSAPGAEGALALCRDTVDYCRRIGDRRAEALAHLWEAQNLTLDARPGATLLALDAARNLARETGSAPMLACAGALRTEALLQLGRWRELEEVVDETLPTLVRLRSVYFGYALISAHSWSRLLRGLPWTAPHGVTVRFRDSHLAVTGYRTEVARAALEFGRGEERGAGLLDWLVANVPPDGDCLAWAIAGVPLLGALALAGRQDDVEARYEAAARFPRFHQGAAFAPLERARAATLLRRWGEAEVHFDAAERLAEAEGLRPALARTLVERGRMERLRGRRGDRARAAATLERAATLCAATELAPDLARCRALQATLGEAQSPALPAGLTPREAEVLRLLAAGRSNRAIADDLVISEKTVERHLLNLYQKLQVESRAQAIAFAFTNDLT